MSMLPAQALLWQGALGVIAAAAVWPLARALHRGLHWPADARGYWWSVVLLMIAPLPLAHLLPTTVVVRFEALLPLDDELGGEVMAEPLAGSAAMGPSIDWPALLIVVYLLGLLALLMRAWRGHRSLRRVLARTHALDIAALPGRRSRRLGRALARRGTQLRLSESHISPFAVSSPAALIVLPRMLVEGLDDCQCWQLLRHEAAHLQLNDPFWMRLLSALCALHWFNPFVWAAARHLRLAVELRCDRPAIRHKHMRRAYAEAYLQALRMSAARALPCAAAAFSAHDQGHHKMRIAYILSGAPAVRKSPWRWLTIGAFGLGATAMLTAAQAASLGHVEVGAAIASLPASIQSQSSASPPAFRGPIIGGRVSSNFGAVRPSIGAVPHRGIDLVAARGTRVHSPAAGRVLVAEAPYGRAPRYGTVVVLDHGDGWQTLYAHLDTYAVKPGDTVRAGDLLGTLGSTGVATGPHVHVEVHRDGERVDPAEVIENIVESR